MLFDLYFSKDTPTAMQNLRSADNVSQCGRIRLLWKLSHQGSASLVITSPT